MNDVEVKQRAIDGLAEKFIRGLDLVQVDRLPMAVYNFDPEGWTLFVVNGTRNATGAAEYVAINRRTGKIRYLGLLGE